MVVWPSTSAFTEEQRVGLPIFSVAARCLLSCVLEAGLEAGSEG